MSTAQALIAAVRAAEESGPTACFKRVEDTAYISLEPKHLGDITGGIQAHLEKHIGKYIPSLGGVPLSHNAPKLRQSSGAISGDSPFIHFYVTAQFTVFAPQKGQQLLGEVNKVTNDHIGLLVYKAFNASVSKESISSQYEFDSEQSRWCDRDFDNPVIEEGTEVMFTVSEIETLGDKMSMKGSLDAPNTGPRVTPLKSKMSTPSKPTNSDASNGKLKRKRKSTNVDPSGDATGTDISKPSKQKKKKTEKQEFGVKSSAGKIKKEKKAKAEKKKKKEKKKKVSSP